jgi:hypothetical protein
MISSPQENISCHEVAIAPRMVLSMQLPYTYGYFTRLQGALLSH